MIDTKLGQTVETTAGQQGTVRYIGTIHVAEGNWLGIELTKPEGKNDGSVRGERYFNCPPFHGLFVRDSNVARIIAQPAPKAKARPSSVSAPKAAPRASIVQKRQSVAPTPSSSAAPRLRKASTASSTLTSSRPLTTPQRQAPAPSTTASTSATGTTSRDSNIDTLQTKIRHLEKQHSEDQDLVKELSQAKDERDRFHGIIQKLQNKCQTLHQESTDNKAQLQQLQSDHDKLSRTHQEHETDWELALLDKEMAEERAEQAESELDTLRAKLEERDMELEILREEATLFTTDMSEDEKQEAGYYRLQHENDRLRHALITLKEMTEEQERDNKARLADFEKELSELESIRQETADLQDRVQEADAINEHLRAQVDANAEWEDISNELTTKNQELEDRIGAQDIHIRDLESIRELNDELEAQRMDEAEDLWAEIAAKDSEIVKQLQKIQDQEAVLADQGVLISKFRDLVFELEGRMADVEASRTLNEVQVKETTGRFNEVMDLNRRLRASNVGTTARHITAGIQKIEAEESAKRLAILKETESAEFLSSQPLSAYFTAQRIGAKASLLASHLETTDRELSYNGGLNEATSRMLCAEAIQHLSIIKSGSTRFCSAINASSLAALPALGSAMSDLDAVELELDHILEAIVKDEIDFQTVVPSLARTCKVQQAVLAAHQTALAALPEDETTSQLQNLAARITYLDTNMAVAMNSAQFVAENGPSDVTTKAQEVLEQFTDPSAVLNKATASARKLLKTVDSLNHDGLFPTIFHDIEDIAELETFLERLTQEAAKWGRNALGVVGSLFQPDVSPSSLDLNLQEIYEFYWSSELYRLALTSQQLDVWIEEAALLANSSEIARGPTPWSQKAKELAAERNKVSETSAQLEALKTEHKSTLLRLHEMDRTIETKDLEVEHFKARFRDASTKVDDVKRLQEDVVVAQQEADQLRQQVSSYQKSIATLESQIARAEIADVTLGGAHAALPVSDPHERPSAPVAVPAQLDTEISALRTENLWLRERENAAKVSESPRAISAKRRAHRKERILSGELKLSVRWADTDEDAETVICGEPKSPNAMKEDHIVVGIDSQASVPVEQHATKLADPVDLSSLLLDYQRGLRPRMSPQVVWPSDEDWEVAVDQAFEDWVYETSATERDIVAFHQSEMQNWIEDGYPSDVED
ncbi:dynein associated protein-domain-containing protein [Phaeosphaeria sp. MPI-PUGE-AT-0046c]|nr:dynein associated protein-domain-containing protein [Phaeosphaeria sp. MPI-PUGE-AT-0046c]